MPSETKRNIGLYGKFSVTRNDGQSAPGEKHDGCDYFVLDITHDPFALPALEAYEKACREKCPKLADDLNLMRHARLLRDVKLGGDEYERV